MGHHHCALRAWGPSPGEHKCDPRQAGMEEMGLENSGEWGDRCFRLGHQQNFPAEAVLGLCLNGQEAWVKHRAVLG